MASQRPLDRSFGALVVSVDTARATRCTNRLDANRRTTTSLTAHRRLAPARILGVPRASSIRAACESMSLASPTSLVAAMPAIPRESDPRALVGARMKITAGSYARDVAACVVFYDENERHPYHVLCDDGHHIWATLELNGGRGASYLVAKNNRQEDVRKEMTMLDERWNGGEREEDEEQEGRRRSSGRAESSRDTAARESDRARLLMMYGKQRFKRQHKETLELAQEAEAFKRGESRRKDAKKQRVETDDAPSPAVPSSSPPSTAEMEIEKDGVRHDQLPSTTAPANIGRSGRARVPSKKYLESEELAALRAKRIASQSGERGESPAPAPAPAPGPALPASAPVSKLTTSSANTESIVTEDPESSWSPQ